MDNCRRCRLLRQVPLALISALYIIAMGDCIIIPDSDQEVATKWVYYGKKAESLWKAEEACRRAGASLLSVDSPPKHQRLQSLNNYLQQRQKTVDSIVTGMCIQSDSKLYVLDTQGCCSPAGDFPLSIWKDHELPMYKRGENCVQLKFKDGVLEEVSCNTNDNFVCESPLDTFQESNITMTAVNVSENTMEKCQAECLRKTGCYAAAPGESLTSLQCYFLLVQNNANPMARRPNSYEYNETLDPNTLRTAGRGPGCCQACTNGTRSATDDVQTSVADPEINPPATVDSIRSTSNDPTIRRITCTPQPQSDVVRALLPEVLTSHLRFPVEVLSPYLALLEQNILMTQLDRLTLTVNLTYPAIEVTCLSFASIPEASVGVSLPLVPCPPYLGGLNSLPGLLDLNKTVQDVQGLLNLNKTVQGVQGLLDLNKTVQNIQGLLKDLAINRSTVSRVRRTKQSAPDARVSAQSLGIFVICLLFCFLLLIIAYDLPIFFPDLRCSKKPVERAEPNHESAVSAVVFSNQREGYQDR